MPPFAECCVIIPCSTIEDFPSRLDPAGARSLLGALTAAWHPRLLASTGRTPDWQRSDDAPAAVKPAKTDGASETITTRLVIVPEVCVSTLPSELRENVDRDAVSLTPLTSENTRELWIRVASREDALEKIAAALAMVDGSTVNDQQHMNDAARLSGGKDTINEQDFFSLGYTWWQTQILTRRLRYTSNLDQIYFEGRVVTAAEKYVAEDFTGAIETLHDCFDALAEERDHYFSSDPAIIDLTLLTPGTVDKWLELRSQAVAQRSLEVGPTVRTGLKIADNILVDEAVAESILSGDEHRRQQFQANLHANPASSDDQPSDTVGWCGGGPASDFSFDENSIATAEQRIASAIGVVQKSGGTTLAVYARLGGGVAGEWVPAIAAAGFRGIVPIDFLGGRGFDDESKVLLGHGETEIEALTAKPIDANDESSFLTLAANLGEAVDRGEIATALLVHWPGGGCDSFRDVRRAAAWSLCLGRFWRIDEYFTDGERPFHQGKTPAASPAAPPRLADLHTRHARTISELNAQQTDNLRGFAALLAPDQFAGVTVPAHDAKVLANRIATSLGFTADSAANNSGATHGNQLLLNPSHPAIRTSVTVAGKVSAHTGPIFHAESSGGQSRLIADVSAWSFALVGTAARIQAGDESAAVSPLKKITRWFTSGVNRIIADNHFSNEFMEATIDRAHGGIDGVYSGHGRGNRFSMRLLLSPSTKIDPEQKSSAAESVWKTICTRWSVLQDTQHVAVLELEGEFQREGEMRRWQSQYRLYRGSRQLQYCVRFDQCPDPALSISDAWKTCPVLRVAVADANPIVRLVMREKLVRTSARTFQSSLGFVIEEEQRSTLIASPTGTVHRRCGDRFYDTLLTAAPQSNSIPTPAADASWSAWQSFVLGFDVRHAVATAKSAALSQETLAVPLKQAPATATQRGWLIHPSPMSLDVQVVDVGRVTSDNGDCMALHLRIVQTASRAVSASLRFCRDVHSAHQVSSLSRPLSSENAANTLTLERLQEISSTESITCEGDRIAWSHPSHGVWHVIVLFRLGERV